jgi:alcohol dehydrogenase, propanol-preferring
MSSMQALQLVEWEAEPELRELPVPEPGPGEVLLSVRAAGLCHSDLHLMVWPAGTLPYELPFTLGHENAGTVAALGAGVEGLEVGETVLVYGPWGCGRCWHCASGAFNLCEHQAERRGHGCGLGFDGGLAEYVVVPSARYLVGIDDLDPVAAAPLTDAALTPYHAVKSVLGLLTPGSEAVVIGIGGLGHVAIQILRALTPARVVAVDRRSEALELARTAGAEAVFDSGVAGAAEIRAELARRGATVVLDFVGIDPTLELAAGLVAPGGQVSVVGVGGGSFPVGFGSSPLEAAAVVPNWGSLPELIEVVELARAGLIEVEVERLTLAAALDGYRRLREGEVVGRAVVAPGGDGEIRR